MTTLILIAKETVPGRVKTRLHPPLSLEQAAELAAAALADTIATVASLPFSRRILCFDGSLLPPGAEAFEVVPQVSGGLDERLAAVFDVCSGPTVLIGMDTPQLRPTDLAPVFGAWSDDDGPLDAWFGPANDGGFWSLALARPDGALLRGIPMSQDDTGARQLERLHVAGLRVGALPMLTDVDTIADAEEVAELAPSSRFAAALTGFLTEVTR
ncbi:TIGR04282 family arsenosugar biosynthesis glycosyltransferase [Galbitalea soli]|uniref:DUF2064 domain-containing protein n=1 Tax=Galbitalea soli TaxID=1268042 RepID=A0A7C9TPJ0_9MICO|nr:DUF2064 domain-containing protein [Galbitalea soli]NEM90756.1 DUF2064 domain-containing protein [Galbitalea soli]NYJ31474.1 hypothetical protein [Galbitalea soli]